jgi:hypothetical protein
MMMPSSARSRWLVSLVLRVEFAMIGSVATLD